MRENRASTGNFDVIAEGFTSGAKPAADRAKLASLADAGATWFIESRWEADQSVKTLRERIRLGPPRL